MKISAATNFVFAFVLAFVVAQLAARLSANVTTHGPSTVNALSGSPS